MAVTIEVKTDLTDAQRIPSQIAPITASFKGLQDQLKQMETSTTATSSKMVTGLQQLSQQAIKQTAVQGDLSKSFLQTGKAAETQLNQFEKLRQQYVKTEASTKGVQSSLHGLITSFKGLAASVGVAFSIQGLVALTQSIVEAGIAHERLMLSLKGALGSAQAAGEAYQFVEEVANRLGIGLITAVEGFAKLTAATQGTVVQGQQTRDLFIAISEASRVMGLTTAETGGVVTALTQIIGKNTVSMEELRQQLGERLPQAIRLVAKEMGLTTASFIEMVSKGQVLAQDFIPAMTRALQQMGKEAPAAAQSVQAALERVGNAWMTLKISIAQSGLLELVTSIANEMTRIINQTTAWFNRTKRMAGELGIAPMVAEMQRLTQEIQAQQEILANPNQFEPILEQARRTLKVREAERDALAQQIEVKQRVVEQDEKARNAADALTKAEIDRQAAEDKRLTSLRDLSKTYTGLEDDIKGVRTQLEALRSFDVPSLQAMGIDPFGPNFEQRFRERETALLKQEQDLLDKRAGLNKGAAARAVQEAGQSAVEIAKAREDALATSLKREEVLIKQSADEQRRITDEAASQALAAEGPGAVEAIAAKRLQDLRKITVDEANLLEDARMTNLEQDAKAREIRLQAEIAAAGKNLSAATKAQEELNNLAGDTEAERVKIRAQTEDALQKVSKKSFEDQAEQARELNKIIKETEQDRLKARIGLVDEQIALVKSQMDGEVLTTQQGLEQIQALQEQRFADMRLMYQQDAQREIDAINAVVQKTKEGSDEQVAAKALAAEQIRKVDEGLTAQLESVNLQQQTQQQEHLNDLTQGWRDWVKDVKGALGDFLFRWMDGQVHSMKDVLNDLKSYFFRIIADMIAYAATKQIIGPLLGMVFGGLGSAAGLAGAGGLGGGGGGGGLMDMAGTALSGLGLANQANSLFGNTSPISLALSYLTDKMWAAVNGLDALIEGTTDAAMAASLEASSLADVTGGSLGGAGGAGAASATLGIAGGLAALGAGIYGALNASNNAAKAAYAASAAAGAAAAGIAAYGAITGAAVVTAAGTGWTGIGLIVAAVMAVIGVVLDRVIKPAGPNLAVGRPGGIGVGAEGGKLVVQGRATSRVIRGEGVSEEQTGAVQQALNEGITAAVGSVIQTINAVALDPAKLLGPTQEALKTALANVQTINSASAKHMEKDIAEQLRFANIALVGDMLEPINMAFEQLTDSDLKTQLDRLPATTMGLVDLFKQMNTQLDEMAKGENRDVLGQIQGVREDLARFGARLATSAGQTAEQIVNGVIQQFDDAIERVQPLKLVSDFSHNLGKLITAFNETMTDGFQALVTLQTTQKTLEGAGLSGAGVGSQIDRLTAQLSQQGEIFSTQIVTRALENLATQLDKIVIQPIRLQATTVDSLFTDSLAAINELWLEWHRLEAVGIDATRVQEQFEKLLGGMLTSTRTVLDQALAQGTFPEFLDVLLSIPDALAKMNPVFERLKALGQAFATVVGPIQQRIATGEEAQRTPAQRMERTASMMHDLEEAIAAAGTSAEQALPLYAQLADAITANAEAQIAAVQQVGAVIEQITGILDARETTTSQRLARVNQRINEAPGGGQGSLENIQTLVTLYGQQLDLIEQLRSTIDAGLDGITETLRADETLFQRVTRLVTAVSPRQDMNRIGLPASPEELLKQASALQDAIGAVRELIDVIEQGLENVNTILRSNETLVERAVRLVTAVMPRGDILRTSQAPTDPTILIRAADAIGEALNAVRAVIDMIEQGLAQIEQTLHVSETATERAVRLVTTLPSIQGVTDPGTLIDAAGKIGDALTAVRAVIELINQGLAQIEQTLHASETVTDRAIRLVTALPSIQGVTGPEALTSIAGQIGEALTAVRAVMDVIRGGIESIDDTLFGLLSTAEQSNILQGKIAAINQQILQAGRATPEQLIALVSLTQQALSVQQQMTQTLESTLKDLQDTFPGTGSPASEIASTRAEIASLQTLADTGAATPEQLQELVDANQKLLDLGEQFDLLDVQQEALDSLKALAPIIQSQIDDSKAREAALVDSLTGMKGQLEAMLSVAQSTEAQLLGQLGAIQSVLQVALAVAQSTEAQLLDQLMVIQSVLQWQLAVAQTTEEQLIIQLTVIQQWLEAALATAKSTEAQLVSQLIGVQALLQAQRAELATAEAITIRYLDAQLMALNAQLLAQYGTTNVQEAIRQIQDWQLAELRALNQRLKDLFLAQPDAQALFGVQTTLDAQSGKMDMQTFHLGSLVSQTNTVINKLDDVNASLNRPLRTTPGMSGGFMYASLNRASTGPLALARGGMVNAILEPGEMVFPPPIRPSDQRQLAALNTRVPRMGGGGWMVPGSGSGDSVRANLYDGTFVLNKRASRAAGFQGGGTVSGTSASSTPVVHHHYYSFPNLTIRNKSDLEELKALLRELERRRLSR